MTGLFSGHEAIDRALDPVRDGFRTALEGPGNRFTVGDTELRVDQVRQIASMVGGEEAWSERGGKQLIRNDTLLGRAFLGYGVGAGRYLSADDFALILGRIGEGDLRAIREPDLAQFVNMVVAEPRHDPRSELAIWAAVAHKLASGHGEEYFSQEIPELLTSYDPLHEEIPEGAQLADGLRPGACRPLEPTLERYVERLKSMAGTPDLEAYVREHLLSRVSS